MTKKDIKPYEEYRKNFRKDLKEILSVVKDYYPDFGIVQKNKITKAFWYAEKAHKAQIRFSGEPYFTHPIAATKILLSIKPDAETICACLLHDVIEDTPITAEEIEKKFGKKIRFLCEGVEKVSKVRIKGKEREFESFKKLFIAMAQDIRVIFIKLSDRIHNLSTLEFVREEKRVRIATESLKIYAPVAEKLGLFEFKTKLEDLCFKNMYPERFQDVAKQIWKTGEERKKFTDQAQEEIKELLKKEKIEIIKVTGRPKNIYSVYQKMKRKNFSRVDEIYDLFAIRIIVPERTDCYKVLGLIHSAWKPIPSRFKDYIAVPKANGYRSLHTTILGLGENKLPTEIQIRTERMHLDAEFGPAAHWMYKKVRHSNFDENYIKKTDWFPRNVDMVKNVPTSKEFFMDLSESLSFDRIHVFTPKGDVKDLPINSTPVDFAYAIHSEVGDICIGAKVNGTIKPLNYELKTGDVVDIIKKEGRKPNPLWLNFVKSSHAISRIRNYINKTKKEDDVLERFEIKKARVLKKKTVSKIKKITKGKLPEVIIGGTSGISYRLSNCCKPLPGEDIVAYNSRGLEFVIHKENCKALNALDSGRFLEAHFSVEHTFVIKANDRVGLLRDYTNIIAEHGINIIGSSFDFNKNKQISTWSFTVEGSSDRELIEMEEEIKKVSNVIEFKRIDKK